MKAFSRGKAALFVFFCAIFMLTLYSCQQATKDSSSNVKFSVADSTNSPTPAQITKSILEKSTQPKLTGLSDDLLSKHFDLPDGAVESFSAYVSSSENNADTIVVFKLTDRSKAQEVLASVSKYLNELGENFKKSSDAEHQKIKNAVVLEESGYIFLFIGDNPKAAENLFKEMLTSK